ncbi:tetratricopeptide repeat protein, partial [Staphylococcus aureus]
DDKSLTDCECAVKCDPQNAVAYNNISLVFVHKGLFQKAIAAGNKAIECDEDLACAYDTRGQAWELVKAHDKAIEDFSHAIKLDDAVPIAF